MSLVAFGEYSLIVIDVSENESCLLVIQVQYHCTLQDWTSSTVRVLLNPVPCTVYNMVTWYLVRMILLVDLESGNAMHFYIRSERAPHSSKLCSMIDETLRNECDRFSIVLRAQSASCCHLYSFHLLESPDPGVLIKCGDYVGRATVTPARAT